MTAVAMSVRSRGRLATVAAVAAAGALAVLTLLGAASAPPSRAETAARTAARAFLARYVDPNGRVVRRDQGGDTVSEGQSYALLLAQVAGDKGTFARVWKWTRDHLQRRDGLLAYLADAHTVRDPMPASDADLVTAWALTRAGGAYKHEGQAIAAAVLRHETASRGGRKMLAAGPWATGSPVTLNPSYWALPAVEGLHGQGAFARLEPDSVALTRKLTGGGRLLPPDWARVDGGRARPTPAPGGQVPAVQYGPDAQRVTVWLAAACDRSARHLAASWWPVLSRPGRAGALALDQSGSVRDGTPSVLAYVAAAASAGAAGRSGDRDRLLARAAGVDAAHPTYYGSAWLALGRALLTTRLLGGCANGGSA